MAAVLWAILRGLALSLLLVAALLDNAAAQGRDEVEPALYELVETALPWPDASFTLANVQVTGTLPSSGWFLELAGEQTFRGRVRARVVPEGGGGSSDASSERVAWVSATIAVEVPVLVATRAIPSGVRADDYTRLEYRDLAGLPRGVVTDPREIEGLITSRALREGEPLRVSWFERPTVIERDMLVSLVVSRGRVTVSDRGLALEAGAVGDVIRVRALSSQTVLDGIVRGEGLVEVP
jgi:flagella basal body P-ring formation protein FlgA